MTQSHGKTEDTGHDDRQGHGNAAPATGTKGVSQQTVGSGKEHDPNNFANNPDRASAAGKKGGHQSHDS